MQDSIKTSTTNDAENNTTAVATSSPTSLPTDLAGCYALIAQLSAVVAEAKVARDAQQSEIDSLKAYVDKLLARLYGQRSEKLKVDPNQQQLDFGDDPAAKDALAEAAAEAEKIIQEYTVRREIQKNKKVEPRTEKFPEHLPRVEETVEPEAEVKTCAEHGEKKLIGYDTTETLEFERPKLLVRVRKFPKYACAQSSECGVTQPERPLGLVEGNRFAPSIGAEITANKYAYHQPLYREQDLFAGSGWTPSRSTLLNILVAVEFVVKPLVAHMLKRVLESGGVGCDDTTVTMIMPPKPPAIDASSPRSQRTHDVIAAAFDQGKSSITARMWAYRSFDLPLNVFDFTVSRHREGPQEILANFSGTLMADCYAGFEAITVESSDRIKRAACWVHARRKFFDLKSNYPQVAATMLALISQLFDVEAEAKVMTPSERTKHRQDKAKTLLAQIETKLNEPLIKDALPKSDVTTAANYLRNNWKELSTYVDDPSCPIDNNDTEQLMRQVALGRKNWLFVGSVAGGERAATLMSLVSSAIRNHLDVTAYIKDIREKILAGCTDYESLLPTTGR
ncbi:MAG: IS66 family transposase [Planctomycetota bacterium]